MQDPRVWVTAGRVQPQTLASGPAGVLGGGGGRAICSYYLLNKPRFSFSKDRQKGVATALKTLETCSKVAGASGVSYLRVAKTNIVFNCEHKCATVCTRDNKILLTKRSRHSSSVSRLKWISTTLCPVHIEKFHIRL